VCEIQPTILCGIYGSEIKLPQAVDIADGKRAVRIDVKSETYPGMLIGVMTPENRVVPRPGETMDPMFPIKRPLELSKELSFTRVPEVRWEQFERVVKVLNPRYLDATALDVL